MSVWVLEAYDTERREARCREYTTSAKFAKQWGEIPRIQFTDSGHGVVFQAMPHSGRRKPTIRRMDWASDYLRDPVGTWRKRAEEAAIRLREAQTVGIELSTVLAAFAEAQEQHAPGPNGRDYMLKTPRLLAAINHAHAHGFR